LDIVCQVSILVVAAAILILVIFAIPILIDLRRIVRDWKKISEIFELSITPLTWGASFLASIVQKILDSGEESRKDQQQ